MRTVLTTCLALLIVFVCTTARATFDVTSKVGAGLNDNNVLYVCVIVDSSRIQCAYGSDPGNLTICQHNGAPVQYGLGTLRTAASDGGIYLVQHFHEQNYLGNDYGGGAFLVVHDDSYPPNYSIMYLGLFSGAPGFDCVYGTALMACPQMTNAQAHPDLAWRLGLTNPHPTNGSVYAFAETIDMTSFGSVCAVNVGNYGLDAIGGTWTWQYAANTLGIVPTHPVDPGPIDAKISDINTAPVAAVRSVNPAGKKILSAIYYEPIGATWNFLAGQQLQVSGGTSYDVAESISIANTPTQDNTLSNLRYGPSLFAVGSDDGLWEDKFLCTLAAGPTCNGGYALDGIQTIGNHGTNLDATTDSMTASWYSASGTTWAEGYSATTSATVSDVSQTDRFGGATASWLQYNPGTGGWVAGAGYDGRETAVRADIGGGGGTHEDWIVGACTKMATNYVCSLSRPYGGTTSLPWNFKAF